MSRVSPMAPSSAHRSGFTLVELLVVVAIIGMMAAIAVPTIFSAVASARNGAVKSELDMLQMALMNYKNEYGALPPADMRGLWLSSGSVNVRHPVYKHLVRVFPRISENKRDYERGPDTGESPYKDLAKLSPAQALVFWLGGFHQNPEFPLTNGGQAGTRKKLFDFDQSRLYAAFPYIYDTTGNPQPQEFVPRSDPAAPDFGKNYPVYFTAHAKAGVPYVYFDSRCYDTQPGMTTNTGMTGGDVTYVALSTFGVTSTATPYFSSLPPANPTWAQLHMSPDTFQLIAAGADGSYGSSMSPYLNAAAFPLEFTIPTGFGTSSGSSAPSAGDTIKARGHGDNLTNFAEKRLADAVGAYKAK